MYPDLLLMKPMTRSGQVRNFNFFYWLNCEWMTWVLSTVRYQQKLKRVKKFSCRVDAYLLWAFTARWCLILFKCCLKFDVTKNNKLVSSYLRCAHNHVLFTLKNDCDFWVCFEHALFNHLPGIHLPHSWQVIMCTNRIWPDLAFRFGFINMSSGYMIIY